MPGTGITVTGLKEAQAMLAGLASEVQAKILRKALREGAMPIVTAAEENAPVRRGKLIQSLQVLPARNIDANTISVPIGPAGGWFKGDVYYAGFQEWGYTTGVKHNKNPKLKGQKRRRRTKQQMQEAYASVGYHQGQHFMTKAFDEHAEEAGTNFVWQVRDGVDRYVAATTRAAARSAKAT